MWESDGPERQFMEWAAAEYKKSHPNIEIIYEPVGSPDARAKIELDGPAGVGADVFVAPHDHVGALVAGGHVLPVEDTSFINDFVDAAKVAGTYDGKLYGYPLAIETYALFYNKDIIIARDYLVVKRDHNHSYRISGYLDDSILVENEQQLGYQQIMPDGRMGQLFKMLPRGTSRTINHRHFGLRRVKAADND